MVHATLRTEGDAPAAEAAWPSERYAWYVVGVLTFATAVSYVDRQIIGLLIEPLKSDLKISDFQVSLLQGLAFVFFYAAMGLPLGYLADRWSRRVLIGVGAGAWTVMTALCGLAGSFSQLFAARLGVGVGEASLNPSAYSLIADYFRPSRISRAFSVLQLGSYAGAGLAYALGGLVVATVQRLPPIDLGSFGVLMGWRLAFLLASIPGILVVLLMTTVREPVRRQTSEDSGGAGGAPAFGAFLKSRGLLLVGHAGSTSLSALLGFGVISWTPSFFIRKFGWSAVDIGVAYGAILVIAGGAGSLIGGHLVSRWMRKGVRGAPIRLKQLALLAIIPLAALYPLSPSPGVALAALAVATFAIGLPASVGPTVIQLVAPSAFRGRLSAIYGFIVYFLGAAGGPMAVAACTDFVFRDPQAVNKSISLVAIVSGPVALALTFLSFREFVRLTAPTTALASEPRP